MAKYSTYETDRVAQNLFNSFIPPAWFPRPQNPDRHVDYFVETNIGDKPSGLIFGVQLRGRNDLKYSKCYVKYCIETRHLKYYIDQAKQPIFLILADTQTEQLYWLFTQQHIRQTLADKDWRNQKSITLFIPKIQKLDAVQPFLRAIEEADRYMRDLWPSSISAAIDHEKNRIEALDPRASIRVLSDGNKTVYEVQPKHGQILNFQLKIHVKSEKWQKILDWWERGEDLELDVGEFSVTNLPLINEIEQQQLFFKAERKEGFDLTLEIVTDDDTHKVMLGPIPGTVQQGTRETVYKNKPDSRPLNVRLNMPREKLTEKSKFNLILSFNRSIWHGKRLLELPYFDQMYAFYTAAMSSGCRLYTKLEFEGNFRFDGFFEERITDEAFLNTQSLLDFLHKARVVAEHFQVNPFLPRLDIVTDDQIDSIEILYDVIIKGEHRCRPGPGTLTMKTDELSPDVIARFGKNGSDTPIRGQIMYCAEQVTYDVLGEIINIGRMDHLFTDVEFENIIRTSDQTDKAAAVIWKLNADAEIVRAKELPR